MAINATVGWFWKCLSKNLSNNSTNWFLKSSIDSLINRSNWELSEIGCLALKRPTCMSLSLRVSSQIRKVSFLVSSHLLQLKSVGADCTENTFLLIIWASCLLEHVCYLTWVTRMRIAAVLKSSPGTMLAITILVFAYFDAQNFNWLYLGWLVRRGKLKRKT